MLVHGQRVPLVGTVAMDAVMADVTDVPGVDLTDEFVLLGAEGDAQITADDLARLRNTIPWEVVNDACLTDYPGCTMPARYWWCAGGRSPANRRTENTR